MTVITSTMSIVHPGRSADAVAVAQRAAKLLERHGATDARLLAAVHAGEATGTLAFNAEYADTAAYGAAADAMSEDPELLELLEATRGPNSPVTTVRQHLASQVDLGRSGSTDRGRYVEIHVSQVRPGRMDDAFDGARRAADYVESRGASNAQLLTLFVAGSASNQVVFSFELPSMRAWGTLCESWTADPEGLALYNAFLGPDPAEAEVFSGLYTAVPL